MATIDRATPAGEHGGFLSIFYDERVRSVVYQLVTFGVVAWLSWYLVSNTSRNLEARGMSAGFGFLTEVAGFDTDFSLIPYKAGEGTYGRIFIVGILNTLLVSGLAIVITTVLGFFVGILRLTSNWVVARLAAAYIEILRNVPLLLQIVYWYAGVVLLLPRIRQSIHLLNADSLYLNIRGLYFPSPVPHEALWASVIAFVVAIVAIVVLRRWAHRRQDETGQPFPVFWVSLAILFGLPLVVYYASGAPLDWNLPVLKGFNFEGGWHVPPAFLALLAALGIYHSCYMAEMVRAGIQSVRKGQTEAALSLGLRPNRTMQLVIIPQAMRAIVPPMISLWMNIVKNSSLAVAIGYSDVVALFMQTALNQSGHAVEIVALTMLFYATISLSISGLMNIYNRRVQLRER